IYMLNLYVNTKESMIEDLKRVEKFSDISTYILNNWDRIFDWSKYVDNLPEGARSLGAMESNQRRITYRMKKRGMHWSPEGAEAKVKVKQGILNDTLRKVYFEDLQRSARKQREVRKVVRMSSYLHQSTRPSIGIKQSSISVYAPQSKVLINILSFYVMFLVFRT